MAKIPRAQGSVVIEYGLACTLGLLKKTGKIDKFGFNSTITTASDPEDIWEGGGIYTYDPFGTAPIVSLASSSGSDTVDVEVTGLDIDGVEVKQTITLQGTTRVALTTALWRVYRMENDGAVDLVGNVFCYTGTGTVPSIGDPEVRAIIVNGNNQTQMALLTIPANKVGFLFKGELGIQYSAGFLGGAEFLRASYKSRRLNKIFKIKKTVSLISDGTSIYSDKRSFPDPVPALTDLKLTADEVSADMGAWASFDLLIVDQDEFSDEFLAGIGQPGI